MTTNTNTNASTATAEDAATAKRSARAAKAAATRAANKARAAAAAAESTDAPVITESTVTSTGRTHAGIDIAGVRLIEDGPGYWIAYRGMSTDRRMGVVVQISAGHYLATGRGMASCAVDSVQEGGEFIARSHTTGQSGRVRTPLAQVKIDLRDAARARNKLRTFQKMAHKSANVTLVARIAKLSESADAARGRYTDQSTRAALAGSEIATRRVVDLEAQRARVLETIEWVENALTLEVGELCALRDKALGLGMPQAEIQRIVASAKPKGDARDAELRELAELLA